VDFLESGVFWTGVVGLAGILATIYGSKRQADSTLAQVAAEREWQAAQHAEEHRRNRQTTYHLFLTAAAQLRAMRGEVGSSTGEADRARWEFLHLLHGVELFGTEDVRQAAMRVTSTLESAAIARAALRSSSSRQATLVRRLEPRWKRSPICFARRKLRTGWTICSKRCGRTSPRKLESRWKAAAANSGEGRLALAGLSLRLDAGAPPLASAAVNCRREATPSFRKTSRRWAPTVR
jgi:hypothetical protein